MHGKISRKAPWIHLSAYGVSAVDMTHPEWQEKVQSQLRILREIETPWVTGIGHTKTSEKKTETVST